MAEPFKTCGQEVLRGREHIADARDPRMAQWIVRALNADTRRQAKRSAPGVNKRAKARAAIPAERRREIAQAAAKARWGKSKAP